MKHLNTGTNGYTTKGVKTAYGKKAIAALNSELKAGKGHLNLLRDVVIDVLAYKLPTDGTEAAEAKVYNDHKEVMIASIKEVKEVYLLGYKEHSNETLKKYAARFGKLISYYDDVTETASEAVLTDVNSYSQTKLFEYVDGFKHTAKGTTPPNEKEDDKTTQTASNGASNEDEVTVAVDVSAVKEMSASELQVEFKRLIMQVDVRAAKVDLSTVDHDIANQVLATVQTLSALLNTVQK